MSYKILRSTEKAHLIEKSEVSFWIPKAWINKDGGLSKRAMANYQDALEKADFQKIENKRAEGYSFETMIKKSGVLIERETEKAILVVGSDVENRARDIWLPKSMVDNYSFVEKKFREANVAFRI
jgi:hypothetical protein